MKEHTVNEVPIIWVWESSTQQHSVTYIHVYSLCHHHHHHHHHFIL